MSLPYHRGQVNSSMNQRGGGFSGGSRDQRVAETNRNLMEEENDLKWAELGEKVSLLKELGNEINQEVKSQNKLLDGMGDTFGTVSNLFTNTISKLGNMISSGGGSYHMYYLVAFVVVVFILLYFMMGRKK